MDFQGFKILKYGPKRGFEPPKRGSNEGHFGAHCGPMRSFHRHCGLFSIGPCVLANPPVSRHPEFPSK